MFKKRGIVFWLVVIGVVLGVLWQTGIIENLTSNAPKEMKLPSQMNPDDDKGRIGTYDKRFLDTCDITNPPPGMDAAAYEKYKQRCDMPTGFSSDSDYLLSPETVERVKAGNYVSTSSVADSSEYGTRQLPTSSITDEPADIDLLQKKIDVLTTEIEQLKKQVRK